MKLSSLYKKPEFLIPGAQKAGTTFLSNLLRQHSEIWLPSGRELHYFDKYYSKGQSWYLKKFPIKIFSGKKIVGESSPYYLYHPICPQRIKEFDPSMKFILLLRNPVDRAISHFHMIAKRYELNSDIEDILIPSKEMLIQQRLSDKLENAEIDFSRIHREFSFIRRGIYVDQLLAWSKYFDLNKQFLILKSEDFFKDPLNAVTLIENFLEVATSKTKIDLNVEKRKGAYTHDRNSELWSKLHSFYEPYNKKLENLTGIVFNW